MTQSLRTAGLVLGLVIAWHGFANLGICHAAEPAVVGVFDTIEVKARDRREIPFRATALPAGREAVLTLKARLAFDRPAGYAPSMRLIVNGKALDVSRLLNKKPTEERVDGRIQSTAAHDLFAPGYGPDFDSPDRHPNYAFKNARVCLFELRVTDLLRDGANTLVIENALPRSLSNALIVAEGRIVSRAPAEVRRKQGPPTGSLPLCVPAPLSRIDCTVTLQDNGDLAIRAGLDFRVESEFSTPEPRWQKGTNRCFTFRREVDRRDEVILVRDTFTNRTDENLPLMQRHRVALPMRKVWLAGLSPSSKVGQATEPANPTVFAATEKLGVGLMPLDDVFQVHVQASSDGRSIGLADNHLVLKPRATHTTEWAIVLTSQPDYFAFVNAARRLRDVNFRIDGPFAFLRADPRLTGKWTDEQLTQFVRRKSARFLCSSIDYPLYQGHYPHGTAFRSIDHSARKAHIARLRKLVPEAQHLVYFHCFIDVLEGAERKYADARLLRSDGKQAVYGEPHDRIFVPTQDNAFGRDIARNVDTILDEIGADGVYWDEMEYSSVLYHYGQPWDGVSADIDPKTMRITRLKSSVTLLSQPYRVALARRILARGPLVANGSPHTRTMAQLRFPRFIETGSIGNCLLAQLFTPIALGDHLTERNEKDAYGVMLQALDFGCVYNWYDDVHIGIPTHAHLTHYMFPITPLELHEGYIIGKERIVTNRSGLFGWNDKAAHEVHVFDDTGTEVGPEERNRRATPISEGGKAFTALRIAEGWSAAIIRRAP